MPTQDAHKPTHPHKADSIHTERRAGLHCLKTLCPLSGLPVHSAHTYTPGWKQLHRARNSHTHTRPRLQRLAPRSTTNATMG